ncbi:aromatic amino acid transaminase [Stomatohabitans albus]|uniref:amino acid aminotransferase n=1 Tax=Stomatohabitans albus TaxID=3110766 RepID=UPI00300D949F
MMLHHLEPLPPDPLLGLTDRFNSDTRDTKVDLGVGMYQNEAGEVPVMRAIRKAEHRVLDSLTSLAYVGAPGVKAFVTHAPTLVLGNTVSPDRVACLQTIAGTGALYLIMALVKRASPDATLWLPNPTWPNHHQIAEQTGLSVKTYPYYDRATHWVTLEAAMDALADAGPNDVVLFHACCHNPTGGDPTVLQWEQLADLAHTQGFQVLMDTAYLGLGDGLVEDAQSIQIMANKLPELFVALSASKSFGIYRERVGAAIVVTRDTAIRDIAQSQMTQIARSTYSLAPAHGGAVVGTVLADDALYQEWADEIEEMGARLRALRNGLADRLANLTGSDRFDFIRHEKGMFSFLGISAAQVDQLIDQFGVYAVSSSRINIGGLREANLDYVANAIAQVIAD